MSQPSVSVNITSYPGAPPGVRRPITAIIPIYCLPLPRAVTPESARVSRLLFRACRKCDLPATACGKCFPFRFFVASSNKQPDPPHSPEEKDPQSLCPSLCPHQAQRYRLCTGTASSLLLPFPSLILCPTVRMRLPIHKSYAVSLTTWVSPFLEHRVAWSGSG